MIKTLEDDVIESLGQNTKLYIIHFVIPVDTILCKFWEKKKYEIRKKKCLLWQNHV